MPTLPAVSTRGKVLFVGSVFNGMKYGSYEVMRRLLHQYSAESFGIVSAAYRSDAAYDFADRAVLDVIKAASALGVTTRITAAGGLAKERVLSWRREGLLVEAVYYPERCDYVEALAGQGAHILALNDSSVSEFGEGELSTIFPTKTPAYLASGRPIMVYCPERYELAVYFRKHKCGIVVTRSEDLPDAIRKVLSKDPDVQACVQNGLMLMPTFSPEHVAKTLMSVIDE